MQPNKSFGMPARIEHHIIVPSNRDIDFHRLSRVGKIVFHTKGGKVDPGSVRVAISESSPNCIKPSPTDLREIIEYLRKTRRTR